MTKEMNESSLFINEPFALRQQDGLPVYTEIKTVETQRTDSEVDDIINNLNKQRHEKGFTIVNDINVANRKIFKETPKKSRVKTNYPIDFYKLKRIILTPNAKGYISTYFIEFAKEHSIPIYWIDSSGKIEASFIPFHLVKSSFVIKQCESRLNGKNIKIAKYIIELKFKSQKMEIWIPNLIKIKDLKGIRQLEGATSGMYYANWKKSFGEEWRFDGRHGRNFKNYLAIDPINSTLNLGYSLLAQQMSEILLKRGWELCIGFLHIDKKNAYWNMLSYDFIEPYRTWIDDCVKEMIDEKEIEPSDFTFSEDKSHMVFKNNALKTIIKRFLKALDQLEYKSLPIIREVESMI
jgi:CRISPR-associated endonuclease Cas1